MMYRKIFYIVVMFLVIGGGGLAYGQEKVFPLIHINQVKNSPVIDGEITPGEWDRATEVMNFRVLGSGDVSTYRTRFYITFDEKNIYVGWECFVPKAQFRANVNAIKRDKHCYDDDSVEIFFDPGNTGNEYYQIIINSIGAIMDIEKVATNITGEADIRWNPPLIHKEKQFNNRWSGEMIIPFSSFGLSGAPKDGTTWGLNFCRNQITAFSEDFSTELMMWSYNLKGTYAIPSEFGKLVFDRNAPVVKLLSMGEFMGQKNNECKIVITNPEKTVVKEVGISLDLIPEKGGKKTVTHSFPVAQQKFSIFYQPDEDKKYTFSINVSDNNTGRIYYSTGPIFFSVSSEIEVQLKPLYFQKILRVAIDTRALQIPHTAIDIVLVSGEKVIETKREKIHAEKKVISFNMDKFLEDTSYQIKIKVLDKNEKEVGFSSVDYHHPKKFDWWNSKAGVSDEVLPPWTPLEVSKNSVKCWGREYVFSNGIWPSQILTRGSEILASPIQLEVNIGTEVLIFTAGKVEIKESKPNRVILTYNDNSSVIKFDGKISIEYDGMIKTDFKLSGSKPVTIDSIALKIPFKSQYGKYYMHMWWAGLENAGLIGEKKEFPFYPYIWVGDEERGLYWFAESDEGWLPYDRKNTITITDEGEQVILRLNILEQQIKLSKPLSLTIGLEATPVKPYPVNYKTGYLFRKAHFYGGPGNWAESHWDRWFDQHMKFLEDSSNAGVKSVLFHSFWANGFGRTEPYDPEKFKKLVFEAHKKNMLLGVYFSSNLFCCVFPEYLTHQYEWFNCLRKGIQVGPTEVGAGKRRDQLMMGICAGAPGYADYLAHGIKKLIEEYDLDGVYYDSLFPIHCSNVLHGHGYYTEDWKLRFTYPIFATRELAKRIYTLFKTMKKESIIDNHRSGLCIPVDAFVDSYWDGEQHAELQEVYVPLDVFRAEFMGEQFGIVPDFIEYLHPNRSAWAITLAHQVSLRPLGSVPMAIAMKVWKVFDEFDVNSAEWFPYWNNSSFIKTSIPGIIVSFYKARKGLLLVVTNWTNKDEKVELDINFPTLGFLPADVAISGVELPSSGPARPGDDLYDKEQLVLSDSKLPVTIQEHNFRMILVTKKGDKY